MVDYYLTLYMKERLKHISTDFKRYLYPIVNWDAQMTGITGPRGIGKSTMVLQYLLSNYEEDSMLYVSADHIYFSSHNLVDTAESFIKEGGKWLCIDEVHKYEGWSRELKQIYDMYPQLRIVFTGSSVLDIKKGEADLSRRALMYNMQGLSFREYLELSHNIKNRTYTLDEIIAGKVEVEGVEHPIPYFRQYLKEGYYPFSIEGDFNSRIIQVVSQTVESDIPQYANMKAATARKLKQLLALVSESAPYKPNLDNLSAEIQVSRNNISDYLTWLECAGMIGQLRDDTSGFRGLGKVGKVYIDNPSLMSALASKEANIGNLRETFFYNQMRLEYPLTASKVSDFRIDDKTFEIGGHNKSQRQIAGVKNGFVVKDDIEITIGNIIPLYHFGFTY